MYKQYEEINIGDTASFTRTITEQDIRQFVELTGDDNPLHTDNEFALRTSYKRPVVHGMLTASFISTLVGKYLPGPGALWIAQNFEFCLPVRLNDTLHIHATVLSKHAGQRALTLTMEVKNQHSQIILKGEGKIKMLEIEIKENEVETKPIKKVTIITGASRGIGATTALYLAKQGHTVIINYLSNHSDAEKIMNIIKQQGGNGQIYQADVTDMNAIMKMVAHVTSTYGSITGLVCNATSKIIAKTFDELSWDDLQDHLDIQLKGMFNCVKAVLPHFEKNKMGSAVIMGSVATDNVPPVKWAGYTLAKSALSSLTKSLALEYGPKGIRFNLVSPGMTDTDLIADIPEKAKLLATMQTPLRRLAKPQDIAQAISFLLNDESSYISGETLRVCGGQIML